MCICVRFTARSVSPKDWMEILSSSHPSKQFSPSILSAGSTKTQFHARLSCTVGICMRRRASNPKEAAASEFHVTRTRQHIDLHKWEASWHFHAGHRRQKWMKVCYQSDLEGEKWRLHTIGHPAQKAGARLNSAINGFMNGPHLSLCSIFAIARTCRREK